MVLTGTLRIVQCWLQASDLVILKPAPPAFVFRNWETKFQFFDIFDRSFITADKLFELGQLLNVVHGGKEFSNEHSNQDFPKTGNHRLGGALSQSVWYSGLKEVSNRRC